MNDCLNSATLWLSPPKNDDSLVYSIIVLVHFTYIAFKYCKDEILVQGHNVLEGIILFGIAQFIPTLVSWYIGIILLCGSLWITGSRIKYKPLPTAGKAILVTGKFKDQGSITLNTKTGSVQLV